MLQHHAQACVSGFGLRVAGLRDFKGLYRDPQSKTAESRPALREILFFQYA